MNCQILILLHPQFLPALKSYGPPPAATVTETIKAKMDKQKSRILTKKQFFKK